ncbi:MAG: hypothetical protein JF616_17970 [Fibrobacteres bacterium]|nr:hypothetical protein [Fibrobacterota bacterium]
MLPAETSRQYRAFLEYRLLMALDRRAIAYWADVTRVLTEALCGLGRHLGFAVSVEKRYEGDAGDALNLRSDVHWQGADSHLWEIDRTVKNASAAKLSAAGPGEKYWVLWARDNDLLSLARYDLEGINVIILGHDVRKLVWDRLVSERYQRIGLQASLGREGRYEAARALDAAMERNRDPEVPPFDRDRS